MPDPGRLALVGRREHFARIASAWEDARDGRTRFVVVLGEPGSGKTRLVEEFHERYSVSRPLTARCLDYAAAPYGPVSALFSELALRDPAVLRRHPDVGEALGALFASDGAPSTPFAKRTAFDAAVQALRLYGRRRPLALTVEDVHWSDLGSLELLLYAGLLTTDARLMVVMTARERDLEERADASALFTRILDLRGLVGVRLEPLAPAEVETLADYEANALGRPLSPRARYAVAGGANGNPLYVRELVRYYAMHGDAAQPGVPPSLKSAVASRVSTLGERDRATLRVASALVEFDEEIVGAVVQLPVDCVAATMRAASSLGLVRANDLGALTFSHELIRRAVYDELLPAERRALHGRIFAYLSSAKHEVSAARYAFHAFAAGLTGEGGRYSAVAGDAAFAQLAFEDAAQHYRDAVEATPQPSFELLDRYAKALERASQPLAAREVLKRCIERVGGDYDTALLADLWIRIARAELGDTNPESARAAIDEALRLLDATPPSAHHYTAHVFRAWFHAHDHDFEKVYAALRDAARYEAFADPIIRVKKHVVAALAHGYRGDLASWRASQREMMAAAEALGDEFQTILALFDCALAASRIGETQLAISLGEQAYERARRRGWLPLFPYSLAAHTSACLYAGELRRASSLIESALPHSAGFPRAELIARCAGTVVAIRLDDEDLLARTFRRDVIERAASGEPWEIGVAVQALAEKLSAEGRITELRRSLRRIVAGVSSGRELCETLVAVAQFGLHDEFPHCLAWLDEAASESRADRGFPPLYRAFIARAAGERRRHALEAAKHFRELGYALYEACALELAGDLRAARELYASCGSLRDLRRLDEAPTSPCAGEPASRLTRREAQIADLTIRGMSNREISDALSVSERTVETHLSSVFAKLHVRSRVQLALSRELIALPADA